MRKSAARGSQGLRQTRRKDPVETRGIRTCIMDSHIPVGGEHGHGHQWQSVGIRQRLLVNLHSPTVASRESHGILPVVPLIGDKRYYGEAPARFRRGPRGGPVQDRRKRGPEAGLSGSQAGSGEPSERREMGDYQGPVRRSRLSQRAASFPRCIMASKAFHRK